jgi:hypothetical protein
MQWATRTFPPDGWHHVQDQFEEEYEGAGCPPDMMLVYVELPDFRMQIYVGLPSPERLEAYVEFDPCPQPPSSRRPKLLMGDLEEHARLFEPHRPRFERDS